MVSRRSLPKRGGWLHEARDDDDEEGLGTFGEESKEYAGGEVYGEGYDFEDWA